MKKLLRSLLLSAVFCFSLSALFACGKGGENSGSTDSEASSGQYEISLSAETLELTVGEEYTLSAENDAEEVPVWASSEPSVASVDQNGRICALAAGETVVTASVGEASDSCRVIVSEPVLSLHFYDEVLSAKVSESYEVTLTCLNGKKSR